MSTNDAVITNTLSTDQAAVFTTPVRYRDSVSGHAPPGTASSAFDNVVSFMRSCATTCPTTPSPSPAPESNRAMARDPALLAMSLVVLSALLALFKF